MTARLRLLSGAVIALAVLVLAGLRADATTTVQYTSKTMTLTISVTPSPVPVGYLSPRRAVRNASARREMARAVLRPAAPQVIAQVTSAQGSAKVNVTTKADPTGAYLSITPNRPSFAASYGSNTYLCAFKINAYFTYVWKVTDWVYGSSPSGGGAFPTYNYPAVSNLSWSIQGVSTHYTPYANQGSPGELAFNAAANVSKSVCVDLQLTVPNTIAAGTYSTTIQYNLFVTH